MSSSNEEISSNDEMYSGEEMVSNDEIDSEEFGSDIEMKSDEENYSDDGSRYESSFLMTLQQLFCLLKYLLKKILVSGGFRDGKGHLPPPTKKKN